MKKRIVMYTSAIMLAGALVCSSASIAGAAENPAQEQTQLPKSYSSVDKGYVTEIKSQKNNDCWAYASMAAFESALLSAGFEVGSMSTDHLNTWATTRSNEKGWIRKLTDNGYGSCALGYLISWQGGVMQSDIPNFNPFDYQFGDEVPTNLAKYGATSAKFLSKEKPDEIKSEIMNHGGVYTSYAHTSLCMSSNFQSYFMPESFDGTYQGHAIELVGWDDNYDASNFSTSRNGSVPQSNGAWLVKNSWGKNNALDGYFWISYEDKYLLHTRYNPSFVITGIEQITDSKKLLQNEIYGATYEFNYVNSNNVTYFNRFDFTDEFFTVDKVIFKTEAIGAGYKLYYVPDKNGEPTSDKANWKELSTGTVDYKGYICDDISDFDVPDKSGSIAVELDSTAADGFSSLGVDEWLVTSDNNYVFINETEKGQSYISYDGKIQDVMDWYKENNTDDLGGNFVIKAVTTKAEDFLLGDVNLDGTVNISDATAIQKHLANIHTVSGKALRAADFNGDGKVDISDATSIQRSINKG